MRVWVTVAVSHPLTRPFHGGLGKERSNAYEKSNIHKEMAVAGNCGSDPCRNGMCIYCLRREDRRY